MEAILIKNGRKIKGKLAEIMVSKCLANWVDLKDETLIELSEVNSTVLDQKAPDQKAKVKKGGRPKGTTKKVSNGKHH